MYSNRYEAVRQAAQNLLSNNHTQRYGAFTSSSASIPSCVSSAKEDIIDLRRAFSLLVTFDLIFTFILWVMAVKMKDGDFEDNIKSEFINYSFHKSSIDFVICSFIRFIFLIFFYVFIKISNPSVIAMTTFTTCIFIIVKAFIYESSLSAKSTIFFVIMIESFLISWIETWFLDFKLLPLEKIFKYDSTNNILNSHNNLNEPDDEFQTPEGSDEEETYLINAQDLEYKKKSRNAFNQANQIFLTNGGWVEEESNSFISVRSQTFHSIGKVFRLETDLDFEMEKVFKEVNNNIREAPLWNKTILESKILKVIDDSTDIVYHVTASTGKGVVKSRDFVSVRHWKKVESSAILSASTSIDYPFIQTNDYIRGETRLGAWIFKPISQERCHLKMLVATDIKGWIPKIVADQALTGVLINGISFLKTRLENLYSGT